MDALERQQNSLDEARDGISSFAFFEIDPFAAAMMDWLRDNHHCAGRQWLIEPNGQLDGLCRNKQAPNKAVSQSHVLNCMHFYEAGTGGCYRQSGWIPKLEGSSHCNVFQIAKTT